MKATICDRCNKRILNGISQIRIVIGREMDPSGNGYNDDCKYFDLCKICKNKYDKFIINEKNIDKIISFCLGKRKFKKNY